MNVEESLDFFQTKIAEKSIKVTISEDPLDITIDRQIGGTCTWASLTSSMEAVYTLKCKTKSGVYSFTKPNSLLQSATPAIAVLSCARRALA